MAQAGADDPLLDITTTSGLCEDRIKHETLSNNFNYRVLLLSLMTT